MSGHRGIGSKKGFKSRKYRGNDERKSLKMVWAFAKMRYQQNSKEDKKLKLEGLKKRARKTNDHLKGKSEKG